MHTIDTTEIFARYPHVAKKIQQLWGTKECRKLLLSLMNDSRNGSRAGFPPSVGSIIISLLQAHDATYPQFDDSNEIIAPFSISKRRQDILRRRTDKTHEENDWGVIKMAVKIIVLIVIVSFIYTIYKKLNIE